MGRKKEPIWRVVVADQRSPRDGRVIETIGRYNPTRQPSEVVVNSERLQHWLDRGAQPSGAVRKLIKIASGTAQAPPAETPAAAADSAPPATSPEAASDEQPAAATPDEPPPASASPEEPTPEAAADEPKPEAAADEPTPEAAADEPAPEAPADEPAAPATPKG